MRARKLIEHEYHHSVTRWERRGVGRFSVDPVVFVYSAFPVFSVFLSSTLSLVGPMVLLTPVPFSCAPSRCLVSCLLASQIGLVLKII